MATNDWSCLFKLAERSEIRRCLPVQEERNFYLRLGF